MKTLVKNAKVFINKKWQVQDLAIEDKHFVPAFPEEEADSVIDLEERITLPGLMDSHLHMYNWATREMMPPIRDCKNIASFLSCIKDYMETLDPQTELVYLSAWKEEQFEEKRMPTKEEIDSVSLGIPLLVSRICGHLALANQALLDRLDWKAWHAKDPGFVPLNEDGEPLGYITEDFYNSVLQSKGEDSFSEQKKKILFSLKEMAALGLQSIVSNDLVIGENDSFIDALEAVYAEEENLPLYFGQVCLSSPEDIDKFLALKERFASHPSMQINQVKLFKDGSLGGRTAYLRKSYADREKTFGTDLISPDMLVKWFETCNAAKVSLVIHAIGDQAIVDIIDAYLLAAKENPSLLKNPYRHAIIHAQIHDDAILEKILESNLCIYPQPLFATSDWEMAEPRLGQRREESYHFYTAYKKGIKMGFSSDSPVESVNPLLTIQAAMQHPLANEQFDFECSVHLYSEGNQYLLFREAVAGKIAEGYQADLSVLDYRSEDLSTIAEDLSSIRIYQNILAGKSIYKKKEQ